MTTINGYKETVQLGIMRQLFFKPFILLILAATGCKSLILFSIEDDKKLGAQVSAEIASKPDEFPVLDQNRYPYAYKYLNGIRDKILQSGKVDYKDEFVWELKIIQNDTVLNAFATPGGYIYVYTGLIKYLDKEDDLAGVLGHEIAHADKRHSIRQLQKVYGVQILLSIALGQNPSQMEQIVGGLAGNLATLRFSRDHEEEADEFSVVYLAQTPYQCNGAYSFFQKMLEEQKSGQLPKFLSTHPAPQDRVNDINKKAEALGCSTKPLNPPSYNDFKKSLP